MMKKLFTLALAAMLALPLAAQISDSRPSAYTFRAGNRPVRGTWGLYMGVTSNMIKNWSDRDVRLSSLPLLNLKYMTSDKMEMRLGIQVQKRKENLFGKDMAERVKYKEVSSENLFSPGFAWHFNSRNILDVYVGAELPLGWSRDYKYKQDDDDNLRSMRHGTFNIGLGGFVGLQAFVGHLPLAIGCEYGLSSMFDCGNVYKYVTENGVSRTEYLKTTGKFSDNSLQADEELKNRTGELGSQFRITVSYYFK